MPNALVIEEVEMLNRNHRSWLVILLLAGAVLSGCATKGFVRNEVASLNRRVDQVQSGADQAGSAARASDQHAGQALQEAQMAQQIALGNVRHEEVRTVTVYFDFDHADFKRESRMDLDSVSEDLKNNINYVALIAGYTDATGDEMYNVGLAQRRASAVHRYLAQNLGKEFVRLVHIGFGEVQPAADNESREGRSHNRRVEISIVRPVPATPTTPPSS